MAKKQNTMLKQIIIGVAVTVIGSFLIAYLNGVFDETNHPQATPQSEAAEAVKGRG